MCLCILFHRAIPSRPLVMAANREEHYDRPADPPAWITRAPAIFAGRDRRAGGSWQGINRHGLLVALTNRSGGPQDPSRRSRGQLCVDALRHSDAPSSADWLRDHLSASSYNPCNLLCADARDAFALHHDGTHVELIPLSPGVHMLTDTDVDDREHPRIRRAHSLLNAAGEQSWPPLRPLLARIMADHADNGEAAICRHGRIGGTVSSSIIAVADAGLEGAEFHYAPGPPCTHGYEDLSSRLHIHAAW